MLVVLVITQMFPKKPDVETKCVSLQSRCFSMFRHCSNHCMGKKTNFIFQKSHLPHAQCLGIACPASSTCIFPELTQGKPFCGCAGPGHRSWTSSAGLGLRVSPPSTHQHLRAHTVLSLHTLTQPAILQKLLTAQLSLFQWETFNFWGGQAALREWQVLAAECPVPEGPSPVPLQQLSLLLPPVTQAGQNSWAVVIPALSCGINDSKAGIEIQGRIGFTTLLGCFMLFYWGKRFFHVPLDSRQ